MRTVTINLSKDLEKKISYLIEKELFVNKSELIRAAIRDLLLKYDSIE
jgi:Arc/MetJ-type ribon-helix-helix transcriptional regulator